MLRADAEMAARQIDQITSLIEQPSAHESPLSRGEGQGEGLSTQPPVLRMLVTGELLFYAEVERPRAVARR